MQDKSESGNLRFCTVLTGAILVLLLLLLTTMTSCCPRPELRPVALGKTEIQRNLDGSWTVSGGWMVRRLRYERALLHQCRDR